MGSGVIIHTPGCLKTTSDIQMLIGGMHRQHGDLISLLLFLQNRESRLKIINKTIMKIVTPLRQQWRQIQTSGSQKYEQKECCSPEVVVMADKTCVETLI
jgi:hypothetical protein